MESQSRATPDTPPHRALGKRPDRLRDYRGKVAVVTGASSGIGAEMARALAARGARVALVARRRERLDAIAAAIVAAGGEAAAFPCDVGDRDAVDAAAAAVVAKWGAIDLLVNSAGFARHVLFKDHGIEDIEEMVRTNVMGPIYWIRATLPTMRAQRQGWIVNLSSFAGKIGQPDEAAYSATKFAVTGLSQALVYELAPLGIHVMSVHPVLVRTEMFDDEVIERMPSRMRDSFMEPSEFVNQTLRALERGDTEATVPRRYGFVYVLRSLFPRMMSKKMGKVKLEPIRDLTS